MTEKTQPTDAVILDAADDFRIQYTHGGTTFDEFDEIGFARALLAEWGQPVVAGEYPELVCDYCGVPTPDPWHSSGMLHGKMSKHIHACDACAAPVDAAVQQDAARLTSEQEYAIRQGYEIAASDRYFEARQQIDSNDRRKVFQAGFERGWDAARKQGANHD